MKKSIDDVKFMGKKVLMRADFNVPIKNGVITSNKRIVAAIPTIKKIINEGGKLILMSHLGRIKNADDMAKNDLFPVSVELSNLLNKPVLFVDSTRGIELENAIDNMHNGDVILMQNTRNEDINEKAESKNNPELGKYWASLGDIFVNDAFGTAHRAHASNVGIAKHIEHSVVGYLMQKEIESLTKAIVAPSHPYVAIIGGAKVSDKIKVLEHLIPLVDKMIIGGGMAYTFKKALGYTIGTSICEDDFLPFAKDFLEKYSTKVILPVDNACAKEYADVEPVYCELNIPEDQMGLDIGPKSISLFKEALEGAKTVVWNGPMGVAEFKNYSTGTLEIAKAISKLDSCYSVVGGGDSVAAVQKLGMENKFSHVSTGGGASLEFLQGLELPGISAIENK